ncbi:MAG: VCBS repeat-containing protein [candidate division Zixibacteria bacterium]|nr:VCBS repeat-containing protein [candidate division Zixibacteria bacterium]
MNRVGKALSLFCLIIFVFSSVVLAGDIIETKGPYECEDDIIEIMFARDSEVRIRNDKLVDLRSNALDGVYAVLGKGVAIWTRISDISEERLIEFQKIGETKSGSELYDMNNAYRLQISEGQDIWDVSRRLEELPGVILARPVPKPMSLPVPISYVPQQGYLRAASSIPSGIDADYAWTSIPGGAGAGVTICDLEYGWNYSHQDIIQAPGSQINPNPVVLPTGFTDDHGTAVIGQLFSDPNGWGTTGISHGGILKTCGTYYGTSPQWNVAGAILIAIDSLIAGDIILLEQQWDYNNSNGFVPIEWWLDTLPNSQSFNTVYSAIQIAVANGIHVVEAGGNGNIDTDGMTWYGNSGAIIVGAGGATAGPNLDRQRLSYSSYGSRFDLQGWGENVVTTGYNDLWSAEGKNLWYTSIFSGTSSSSPIVSGAMASCAGFWTALGWNQSLLTPSLLRNTLVLTGTPQDMSVFGNIGPRPNIRAACSVLVQQEIEWKDRTVTPVNNYSLRGYGCAWGDYDNDGDDDLHVANYGFPNKLYRNDGGGNFTDVTPPILADPGPGRCANWADIDNDGDLDLYLANDGLPNFLYRNDGGGVFVDITMPPLDDASNTQAAVWADFDNDGLIDLFLANYMAPDKLFQNTGGGNFVDVSMPPVDDPGPATGASWGDHNNDGLPDLLVLQNSPNMNRFYQGLPGGAFLDMTGMTPLSDTSYCTSAEWFDIDNNGFLDVYLTNNGQANLLCIGDGTNFIPIFTMPISDTSYNFGSACHDYDNDGDIDIFVTGAYHYNKYFRNLSGFMFSDHTTGNIFCSGEYSLGTAGSDIDGDGDVDLYVANGGTWDNSKLFENKMNFGYHWLQVKLIGTVSNKAAIGAHVFIYNGPTLQMREISGGSGMGSQNSLTAMFGLGVNTQVDSLIVFWPSGTAQKLSTQSADQLLVITEPGGGTYTCGDANSDLSVNVGDAVYIINYAFKGGPAPNPLCQGDANGDGVANVGDAVYLINYAFKGGPAPITPCCP